MVNNYKVVLRFFLMIVIIVFIVLQTFCSIPFIKIGGKIYPFYSKELILNNSDVYKEKDIKNIAKFNGLISLSLTANISDLSFLNELNELQELFLFIPEQNNIDYSCFKNCKSLKKICILTPMIDAKYFGDCNNLEYVELSGDSISNIDKLWKCNKLISVSIRSSNGYKLDGISKCNELERLSIDSTEIIDLKELKKCNKLNSLSIHANVKDYDVLLEVSSLKELIVKSDSVPKNIMNVLRERNVNIIEF